MDEHRRALNAFKDDLKSQLPKVEPPKGPPIGEWYCKFNHFTCQMPQENLRKCRPGASFIY
eukprot:6461263-Amphidinium_carterae.1